MRLGGAILLCLALSASARADEPPEAEARKAYMHAQSLFDAGQFSPALAEYQRSYALASYPAILYRIGLCQDLLGRREEALASYRKFLADAPESDRRDAVETRIHQLELAAMPSAPPAPPPPTEKPPELRWVREEMARVQAEQEQKRAAEERQRAEQQRQRDRDLRIVEAKKVGAPLRIAGGVMIPLGVALFGLSFAIIPDLDSTRRSIASYPTNMPWGGDGDALVAKLNTDTNGMIAMWSIALASTATGIVLVSVGAAKRSRAIARARGADR